MLKGMTLDEIHELGLDAHDINIHQMRITQALQDREGLSIPIIDTCRLDNGGILPAQYLTRSHPQAPKGFVAFVPAAGAASRYFKPLTPLRDALLGLDHDQIASQHRLLRSQDCNSWPLPAALRSFFKQSEANISNTQYAQTLIDEIDLPKALLPCWTEGASFLQVKSQEHQQIAGIEAEYYIAPMAQSEVFQRHLQAASKVPSYFMEQGKELSTLRFLTDGLPYRDQAGQLSLVPAGHGMLVKLFNKVQTSSSNAHSMLIRNIDNVNGSSTDVKRETELFLVQHQTVLYAVKQIRLALNQERISEASVIAEDLLRRFINLQPIPSDSWIDKLDNTLKPLWHLIVKAFHCPDQYALHLKTTNLDHKALKQLYARPLNTLGQVPNSGSDIGGSPVFARTMHGEVSICLELPHVSNRDRQEFLENPKRATHFNPVFVAAEIPKTAQAYDLEQCPFWILADKIFHGQPVVYHETVLYEAIGNSLAANLLFPTISRQLFNPHKTLHR